MRAPQNVEHSVTNKNQSPYRWLVRAEEGGAANHHYGGASGSHLITVLDFVQKIDTKMKRMK